MNKAKKQAKSIFFVTLGCRLNQAETEKMRLESRALGFESAKDEDSADIYIFNSCSVTDKAQRDTTKMLKKVREKYPQKELFITGCGARDEHKKYAVIVKNEDKSDLLSHLERNGVESRDPLKNVGNTIRERDFSARSVGKSVEMTDNGKTRLMVKVQDGCNNFCTYCIVPYLRGREDSRSASDIIKELKEAEKSGFKEIVLCGVNIGKYSFPSHPERNGVEPKDLNLADLIGKILKTTAFPRIRLSSINPDDFSDDLVALWAQNGRLCNHFHISLQSGSDTVLKRMGRKYDTMQYSDLTYKLREKIHDIQITTDIIVGFPGETQAEFAETMEFVKKMQFLKVHVFRYSKREGTRATKMPNQIDEKVKKERAAELNKLETDIRVELLQKYIGREVEVLFEQKKNDCYSGFTTNYIKVSKKSQKDISNQIIKVKIKEANKSELLPL